MPTNEQQKPAQAVQPGRVLWQTALAVFVLWRLGRIFRREGS
jgi:hypothetical protein